jgi:uncharacterized RDD family membrane protein YckC
MKPAAMAARATAVIIDALLVFLVLGPAVGLVTGQLHHSQNVVVLELNGWPAALWLGLSLAYWVVGEHVWGMTIGKRLFSIQVESREGGRPSWNQSLVRNLMRVVDGFPYLLPYLLGFLVAESSARRTRIGDRVAGTHVVARD